MAVYRIRKDSLFLTEFPMYGEKRLGVIKENKFLMKKPTGNNVSFGVINFTNFSLGKQNGKQTIYPLGKKHYETTDWLGNVRVTYTDKKSWNNGKFALNVSSSLDYYPFGSVMEGRDLETIDYRYGWQNQERVDEISGVGNHYTAPYWEYDPRVVTRWNRDPVTFPWQSPYVINNNNPIVFTDPLGLFGSRGEAREYKKEHGLKGRIQKGDDGIFAINNKREGTSYFRDPSLDDVPNLIGRQEDGVIKSVMVSPDETPSPSTGDYVAGLEEFGKRGGKLKVSTEPLKSTGKIKYYDNNWGGNQYTKTKNVFNKGLTKGLAKKAPIIGGIITASEIIDGIQADGNAIGANTAIEVAGAVGGAGGAWGGAAAGAAIGSLIFPGVGTVVGGAVGAVLGSWGGEAAAEGATRAILKE